VALAAPAQAATGPLAYVTDQGNNTVSAVDTSTGLITGAPIPVGTAPGAVAVCDLDRQPTTSPSPQLHPWGNA
jgi:YVTN family beta-propeller protein